MARKHKHEDHINHEAWAIPYGDLITLLLAFFVVMYSMSSVNEGKYRVLSDSLSAAFGGPPRSVKPVQFGEKQKGEAPERKVLKLRPDPPTVKGVNPAMAQDTGRGQGTAARARMTQMAEALQQAMGELIDKELVVVTRTEHWLEVQIRTDILFASGASGISEAARPVLNEIAAILKPFPNVLRIEGHTDDRPIATAAFPSNWELSAARAASVVHLFMQQGVHPPRMTVAGYGPYRPVADNRDPEGRNRNRRVVIVILSEAAEGPRSITEGERIAAKVEGEGLVVGTQIETVATHMATAALPPGAPESSRELGASPPPAHSTHRDEIPALRTGF